MDLCAAFSIGCQQGVDDQRVLCVCISQGVQLFSRESKAGPRVRWQSMQKYQGISILFFSRQSKARLRLVFLTSKQTRAKTSCDSKMADETVVQERENQCKAEINKTSSAQCPMSLKGRRPQAPRGSTVLLKTNSENASSRLRRVRSCVASRRVWSGQQNRSFPNPSRGTRSMPVCTQYGCSRPWSTVTARGGERCTRPASVLHGGHDESEGTTSMQAFVQLSKSQRELPSNAGEARLRGRQPG